MKRKGIETKKKRKRNRKEKKKMKIIKQNKRRK
jgi:hypothetical protein